MYCVSLTYAMQAASSPSKCTWGLRMVVFTALQFLPNTGTQTYTKKKSLLIMFTFHVTVMGKPDPNIFAQRTVYCKIKGKEHNF